MTNAEADKEVWRMQYDASVNMLYYEKLLVWFHLLHALLRYGSMALAVYGVWLAFIKQDDPKWVIVGIGAAILADMIGAERLLGYVQSMRVRWLGVEGDCRQLRAIIETGEGNITRAQAEKLGDIQRTERAIEDGETWLVFRRLHNKCQAIVNCRITGIKSGTWEDVCKAAGGNIKPVV